MHLIATSTHWNVLLCDVLSFLYVCVVQLSLIQIINVAQDEIHFFSKAALKHET